MELGENVKPLDPTLTIWTLLGVELAAELVDAGAEEAGGEPPYCPYVKGRRGSRMRTEICIANVNVDTLKGLEK
jgi:hypothetical protein